MFDRSACAKVRVADAHVDLTALTNLAAIVQRPLHRASAAPKLPTDRIKLTEHPDTGALDRKPLLLSPPLTPTPDRSSRFSAATKPRPRGWYVRFSAATGARLAGRFLRPFPSHQKGRGETEEREAPVLCQNGASAGNQILRGTGTLAPRAAARALADSQISARRDRAAASCAIR